MKHEHTLPSSTYLQPESRNVPVDQRVLILRLYHECSLNAAEAARQYNNINPDMRPVTGRYVLKLVEKFDKTGTVCNARKTGRPRFTTDNLSACAVIREVSRMNDVSIRKIARRCDTTRYAVYRILKERNFRLDSRSMTEPNSDPLAHSITTQIVTPSNNQTNSNSEIQVASRSIHYDLTLLTPPKEVPSGPLTKSNTAPHIRVSPVPTPLPSPQILHVCSRTTHADANVCEARATSTEAPIGASPSNGLDGAQNSLLSHNPLTTVQPSGANVSAATVVNRIDLSVSNDEDPEPATSLFGANKVDAADGKLG
ncbi:unnamed protein product, partial [Dicrocoelium dendriticum]